MSERYTREDAEQQFHRLRRAFGKRHTEDYGWHDPKRIDSWSLDWNATYGGGVIEEQDNPEGGINHPFSQQRRNAREFCDWAFALFEAFRLIERTTGRDPLTGFGKGEDECEHVRHLHIDDRYEAGNDGRYVTHIHVARGLLATAGTIRPKTVRFDIGRTSAVDGEDHWHPYMTENK